jgi:hypothetical protein
MKPTYAFFFQFIENQEPLYMFRALLAHPQEVLNKRHLVYCSETATVPQPNYIIRTQYTNCHLWSAFWGWASNARNMWWGYWFSINWMKIASLWFHYTDCTFFCCFWLPSKTLFRRSEWGSSLLPDCRVPGGRISHLSQFWRGAMQETHNAVAFHLLSTSQHSSRQNRSGHTCCCTIMNLLEHHFSSASSLYWCHCCRHSNNPCSWAALFV